jgi:hypothetical protein
MVMPALPFLKLELTDNMRYYLGRFSIKKEDLVNNNYVSLIGMPAGSNPNESLEGKVFELPLTDMGEVRKGPASSVQAIKDIVEEFDDFVVHITTPKTNTEYP